MKLCYCTDVEGNIEYFNKYIALSEGVYYDYNNELELYPGYGFVFGGDVGDKGFGTLRMYQLLVNLKKKYPERVVLIAGNRDVNKMRFTSELTDLELNLITMNPELVNGPLWVPSKSRVSVKDFLCYEILQIPPEQVTTEMLNKVNTKINRVKWMLKHTMGSDGDFEKRRIEIAQKTGQTTISDDAIVDSFIASVLPGGVIYDYLHLSILGYLHNNTLFVHGGIMNNDGECSIGHIPGAPMDPTLTIAQWIYKLNIWYQQQLKDWLAYPEWTNNHEFRGGEELQKYGLPNATHSVINGRHLYPSGMPRLLPSEVTNELWNQGIHRIIMGHTPHGVSPTIVKQQANNSGVFEVVMCDTSYSDVTKSDNRGNCAHELLLNEDTVHLRGYINKGDINETFDFKTHEDKFVGHQVSVNGPWIKLPTQKNSYLLCTVTNGFTYSYQEIDASTLYTTFTPQ
ncbi:hypothetical protein THRCLA_07369 [Thraustotheca clavata]|uniref:Calcineurin-like phosphoesterase domain-containing protein n=1 Tax=Thraustotheca clavata TaxID=74557 RepID=A0A1V9ZDP9_9STRA|nr:hypothetical protein THRCLA_07369 [Thraustotheca clavata]